MFLANHKNACLCKYAGLPSAKVGLSAYILSVVLSTIYLVFQPFGVMVKWTLDRQSDPLTAYFDPSVKPDLRKKKKKVYMILVVWWDNDA